MEMDRTYSKNEGQQVDQTLQKVTTKERKEIKGTTKQKIARRHSKGGKPPGIGKHQTEDNARQLAEGCILLWTDKAKEKKKRRMAHEFCQSGSLPFSSTQF